MLKQLRLKLTFICSIMTASILIILAILSLLLFEGQLKRQSQTAFKAHLDTLTYKLQTDQSINHLWLSQMETAHHLVIAIEDNGIPLLFQGSFPTRTSRSVLIETAKSLAFMQYGFNPHISPSSNLELPSVSFEFTTAKQEHFLAATALIPSINSTLTVTLLQDMQTEDSHILRVRLLFSILVLCSILLLAFFSWWFAGRSIVPIEESRRKQVEFIAAASHELRAPLAVMQTSLGVLSPTNIEANERFIKSLHDECKRMSHLVDDLLLLANADAHTWSIHYTDVELDTLLIESIEAFHTLAKAKGLSLHLVLPNEIVPSIQADSERLKQAIAVLIDNALCYTPSGSALTLSLNLDAPSILIKVIDHGVGIPDHHKAHIFDRFYRVDAARHEKEHYGLGLSIAYEIIHLHKGTLSLEDTPGGGCTFTIQLPLPSHGNK